MSLGKFLNDVYKKKCNIKQSFSAQVISDIECSVKELLWRILTKARTIKVKDFLNLSDYGVNFGGTFEELFPISKLIPVGSFYEDTKVGDPFEFDFMLYIELDNVEIQNGCSPGLVKIKRPQNVYWTEFLSESFVEVDNKDCVYPSLIAVFNFLYEKITNENSPYLSEEERIIDKSSGTLKCLQSGMLHLAFLWTPEGGGSYDEHVISVDTMPAFVCPEEYIQNSAKNGNFDYKYLELVKEQKCYLIPKPCITASCTTCFHVTFATSENKLMKDLDELHKNCYIILKHLVAPKSEFEDNLTDVSSYKLKTCLLQHVYDSSFTCTGKNIEDCTLDILQKLIICYSNMKMPKFFQRDASLFFKSEYSCSVMDVLIPENKEIGLYICQNQDEKQNITEAYNIVAWFELTRTLLMIWHELMVAMKFNDHYDFYTLYEPFEDITHILDAHFATSTVVTVTRGQWIDKLMGQQFFIPMFSLLSNHVPHTVLKCLEGKICLHVPIPTFDYEKFKLDKDGKIRHELQCLTLDKASTMNCFVYLVSGWFAVYDGQNVITKKCCGEHLKCVALLHHTFWKEME
ncbi:unnamed protein product [Mytilus coruscus]|uniref:Uncharacterized protein n=1 Tax=Mytilus coruscus TaxID=42192 RepID=A0A6J8C7W2_MYTCO|nr:unnamed protein product [Mytilus coruscus]